MEMKMAEDVSFVPLGRIASVKFSLATPQEIVRASNPEPIQQSSQLCGPLLGLPTESRKCLSCGSSKFEECEGHFGHIRLPTAVYHPSHIQEVVRILERICLNCFKLKKKKISKSVNKIMETKMLTDELKSLDGVKNSKPSDYRRHAVFEARNNPTDSDTTSTSEEDPLLCSLIPASLRNSSKIKNFEKQNSKNLKLAKGTGKPGTHQTNQSAVLGKRKVSSCMEGLVYNEQENCKYCEDSDKKSVKAYPKIKVKIVPVDNGTFRVIDLSTEKEIPPNFWNFVDRYSGLCSENKSFRTLLPFEALKILRQIPETESKGFGLSPEGLIWECVPVPPNCARISAASFQTTRVGTDAVTQMLKKVINTVERIRESRGGKPTYNAIKHESKVLQSMCSEYLQAQGGLKVIRDKESLEFNGHNGKTKSFSNVLVKSIEAFLKKTSGFSARGVISGDAYREVDQIGIPLEVASTITVEERVTEHNKEKMQNIVNQGLYNLLVDRGGNHRSKEFLEMAKGVEIGEIIHRQLADGDIVFVNRPPSIHKHSFLALKVCIQPNCNFSICPLICPPLDADFDGDCIHVFVPQSLQSRAEISQLLTLDQQLIDSQGGQMLLMLTQDTLLAASLILSMPFLNQITIQQLSIWTSSALPEPAIIKSPHGGPYWTGCQLFQMFLPPDIYCFGNGVNIYKSEILCFNRGAKQVASSIELILQTLILQKGPSETLNFLNSTQHCLTEWLSQQGLSVGLDDVHPFHVLPHKIALIDSIKKCVADTIPLLKHKTISCYEVAVVPYLQAHVGEAYNRIQKYFSNSNSLVAIVDAGSGCSMNKVAQQTEFLGLQTFKDKELVPREWRDRFVSSLKINEPSNYDNNICEAHGLILSSIANGLKPQEAFINAISSRETLFCKAIEVKEPGTLFKKLMSFLRDIVISYDGSCWTTQGNHLVQFKYDCNVHPKYSGSKKLLSECQCDNTKIKVQWQQGDPVGVLAATAIANPSYKILLNAVQKNISSWHLLKETLFHGFGSKLSDQTVILCLQSCVCKGAYCLEKTALKIQRHLQKIPLKLFSVSVEVWYADTDTLDNFAKRSLLIGSPYIGRVQLDEGLLKEANLSIDSLLLNLKRSIKSKGNPLYPLSDRLTFWISERCSGGEKSKEKDNPKPCLHFALETSDDSQEKEDMVDVLVNVICPNLMETTAKGYDCIQSVRISWSPVNSASWVPLQIGEHESVEGEIIIEAIVEKSEVKQCGDAWKIIHEACSSLMGSLDTNRCIPYNINAIYKYFGISAAYYILLQRLCYSVNSIGSHVYKEHLILISNYMCISGKVIAFTPAGYRHLLESMRLSAPFAEAGLGRSLKCFENAAKRSQEDTLSSTLACCSWGQFPLLGTGGNFKVLWNNNEQASDDPSDQVFKHEDVYDFLENIGTIPHGNDGLSSENYLDETLCGEIDDDSESISPDAVFVDTSRKKGMANFIDKDFTPLCDLSAKSPNRINGNNNANNLSGWEASTMLDSQTDGWACGSWANKDAGDQNSVSQLKIATKWDTNSTLVDATKLDNNQLNPCQYSRLQTCKVYKKKKKKNLEVNDDMRCWSEKVIALQASKDPDFPPGFPSVKGGYKEETVPLQQIESETSFPSDTDILKTSRWKDYADEQGQHELFSCDIKSDNTLKSKLTNANLILGKGSHGGIQWEADNRSTSQDVEQRQRTSEEAQGTGWSVDQQADVSETSWTTPETRLKEAQATRWRMDQRIFEEKQPTGWSVDQHAEVAKINWTMLETKVERLGKDRSLEKKVFEQEQVDHDQSREPSCAGNLTSPLCNKLLKAEQDECKLSSSFRSHKFKPTGANLVPIGTRSHKRAQSKSYENSPVREYLQDQAPSTEMQQKDWELNCNVEEHSCKSCMAGEPDGKCHYSESNAQNALLLGENFNVSVDLHTPRRFGEDVLMNSSSNLETKKNAVLSENKAARCSLESSGWGLEKQNDSTMWTMLDTKVEKLSEERTLEQNVFEQEQVGHDKTREPLSAGNFASPGWTKLPKGEQDECKHSSSFRIHKFKPTGANLVPIGTRSHKRARSKSYEKSPVGEYVQDQAPSLEMQQKDWGLNWHVEEDSCKSCMAWEPDEKCKYSESNAQNTLLLGENSNVIADVHTPRRFGEDVLMNSSINLETVKNDVMTDNKAARCSLDSSSWGLENQNDSTTWETLETRVERLSKDRSLEKNVVEQEQVGHHKTREPLSTGDLASPVWTKLLKREQDECKISSSFGSHKFKPTGANLVPIGTRSNKRAQSKSYEKSPVRVYVQEQAPSLEVQQKDWGLNCHVEEDSCKSFMAQEPDGKCLASVDLHTPRRFGEDVLTNSSSNLETEKNDVRTEKIAERSTLESSGWGLENQNDSTTSGWELPCQSDPFPVSGWELPNESDPPTISNWELQNHSVYRRNENICMKKSMEDVRPTDDKTAFSSSRSTKRNWVHMTHKNGSARSSRKTESLTGGVIDRPSKLQEIFYEINPLMHLMRMILHYGRYNSGDRLWPEDEREVLEKVLIHHPEAEAKMGCGVDFIVVDNHAQFSSTRCFYIVRKDGTRTDFSYLKCLKGLVEKKFPDSAKDFIENYIKRN
ncbi:DNA-directed RNA polymerase V subunit 1 isoform X1 [Cryptomeria japonica]|uniref:DNA-directed RNA polymerase V subunit 1 isoform X1 n=1 Tax=Cryptomeria japonica TaxID=3369 RepID=UPI0027DA2894|nr:DNA-directed RNA polymerase V subunit 1 isoform X1 [Cryptomeria japonica]